MSDSPIRIVTSDDGQICTICLARPKGNVLDTAMVEALIEAVVGLGDERDAKTIILTGDGGHFSFGASVHEHLPDSVESMLRTFHGMFRALAELAVPVLAAVRGNCLGGGLELASFCHRVFASQDARLGQPEIKLGVFAPLASLCLPERVGRGAADHLCLTGEVITASRALEIGLVDEIATVPIDAAMTYARRHLLPLSASSLRFAVRAVRADFEERLFSRLEHLERLYLDQLMATGDALEGIRAFIAKREPEWRNS